MKITDRRATTSTPAPLDETAEERRLRHAKRRQIRHRLEQRRKIEAEVAVLQEHIAEIDARTDEESAEHQRITQPLQAELEQINERSTQRILDGKGTAPKDAERRAEIGWLIDEANAKLKATAPEANRGDEISLTPQTERDKLAVRARQLKLDATRLASETDLARPGIGDPALIARLAVLNGRLRMESEITKEAAKLMRYAIDGDHWERGALTTWRRRKREAKIAHDFASEQIQQLNGEIQTLQAHLIEEPEE